jgi:EAL domain-containing protein (putative c-di-GMP-specific phosphodiesterase class I)
LKTPVIIAGGRLLCIAHIGISVFPNDTKIAEDFNLYFQPKQLLETRRISGAEALVCWNHSEYGEILPVEFIPIAERSRLILPLGTWILRKACEQIKKLNDQGLGPLKVAVNLSALQFNDEYIVETVRGILDETGMSPEFLELEITESIAMNNATSANETFKKMDVLGVSLSIDDFGTGYSRLAYVKNFKVQRIKINKLFIDDIATDMGAGSIARAVTTMSHSFGMDVTVEGVTNKEQVAFLRRLECDEIQGDYFSSPLIYDEFFMFIKSFKSPEHYEQGFLNWSDFRELSGAISGNLARGKRRYVKDQRNSKK